MSKSTFSNAAGLLAILIARGIINYTNLIPSQQERDELKEMKESKRQKQIKAKIINKIKVVKGQEEPEGVAQLRETLTQINNRYPEVPADINDDVIKNISSVVLTYSPSARLLEGEVTDPFVVLPQPIAQRMQEEILRRRTQETEMQAQATTMQAQATEIKEELDTKNRGYKIIEGKRQAEKKRTVELQQLGESKDKQINKLINKKERLQQQLISKNEEIEEYKLKTEVQEQEIKTLLRQGEKEAAKKLKGVVMDRLKENKKKAKEYEKLQQKISDTSQQIEQKISDTSQQIEQKISDTSQQTQLVVRDTAQQTQSVLISRIERLSKEIKDMGLSNTLTRNVERKEIIPEQRGISGLGLTNSQRQQLRQIITRETNSEYANIVDMIAGEELETTRPADIMRALTGLAVSVAVPIPRPILNNLLNLAGRATGFDNWFNNMFVEHKASDNLVVLTQNNRVTSLNVIQKQMPTQLKESQKEPEEKHSIGPAVGSRDQNLQEQTDEQKTIGRVLPRGPNGRFAKKSQDTSNAALLGGATAYAITGSVASAVTGASIGGLVGALSPAISRIGDALAERLPDTIPTTTGIQRAVQRQITTDTQELKFRTPEIGYKTEDETIAELETKITQLRNELTSTTNENLQATIRNQIDYMTSYIATIRENGLSPYDQKRRTIRLREQRQEIPTLRRTTDDEKALVPFNEAEERTTYDKKKALAVAGAVGSAVVAAGVERSGMFKERPIELPAGIYSQQQGKEFDTAMPNMARGMLRPKFIMPDADILQPSNQELAADALEFAMFDFVEPSSEGAEGTNQTNILKAFQKENENIRYNGAGVVVNSLFGNDANNLTPQQIAKMFLGPELPPLIFSEIQQNLSEYEVSSFDVNNELTGIEFFSPYNNFTNVDPGLNENNTLLFDVVP